MKQTAIDFLIEKLQLIEWIEDDGQPHEQFKIIELAKLMHKRELLDAYNSCLSKNKDTGEFIVNVEDYESAERWYNMVYNNKIETKILTQKTLF
jgi:hypothetical protein